MTGQLLLDTGAFVALLDRSEARHVDCVAALEGWTGAVLTTEAVLTETLHLVAPSWSAQRAALEFLFRGAVALVPSSEASLRRVGALMERYRNLPMDFADATLVVLAEDVGSNHVLSLDRRGFATYRLFGKQSFTVMP